MLALQETLAKQNRRASVEIMMDNTYLIRRHTYGVRIQDEDGDEIIIGYDELKQFATDLLEIAKGMDSDDA